MWTDATTIITMWYPMGRCVGLYFIDTVVILSRLVRICSHVLLTAPPCRSTLQRLARGCKDTSSQIFSACHTTTWSREQSSWKSSAKKCLVSCSWNGQTIHYTQYRYKQHFLCYPFVQRFPRPFFTVNKIWYYQFITINKINNYYNIITRLKRQYKNSIDLFFTMIINFIIHNYRHSTTHVFREYLHQILECIVFAVQW